MNPFDYSNAILETKQNLITDEASEKAYNPFLVNRALSYFPDTIIDANLMNVFNILDKKLQFDYLINSVRRSKRRRTAWGKKIENRDMEMIRDRYGYNHRRAKEALSILSDTQLKMIREEIEKGV
jgi:hypothetical protein